MPFGVRLIPPRGTPAVRVELAAGDDVFAVLRDGNVDVVSTRGERLGTSRIAGDARWVAIAGEDVVVGGTQLALPFASFDRAHDLGAPIRGVAASRDVVWCWRGRDVLPFSRDEGGFRAEKPWRATTPIAHACAVARDAWLVGRGTLELRAIDGSIAAPPLRVPHGSTKVAADGALVAIAGPDGALVRDDHDSDWTCIVDTPATRVVVRDGAVWAPAPGGIRAWRRAGATFREAERIDVDGGVADFAIAAGAIAIATATGDVVVRDLSGRGSAE